MKPVVSIIIPTKNSSAHLVTCLKRIREQKYRNIEIIIVDGKSNDYEKIVELSKQYKCILYAFDPKAKKGLFDATKKRNFGAKKATGEFIYFLDADMEINANVVLEAIAQCNKGFNEVIIPEDSFGKGPWAKAKNLERRFYWGDNTVESPRFFTKKSWIELKGYDENIAGGGDDRDLYQKALEKGHMIGRIKSLAMSNEGDLRLLDLLKKQFMYKREVFKYIRKRPLASIKGYFPIRRSHIINWKMFISRPKDTFFFVIMKTGELIAGILGLLYSLIKK